MGDVGFTTATGTNEDGKFFDTGENIYGPFEAGFGVSMYVARTPKWNRNVSNDGEKSPPPPPHDHFYFRDVYILFFLLPCLPHTPIIIIL